MIREAAAALFEEGGDERCSADERGHEEVGEPTDAEATFSDRQGEED